MTVDLQRVASHGLLSSSGGTYTLLAVTDVRGGTQYYYNSTLYTGSLASTFSFPASTDPVNTLMTGIKAALRTAQNAGSLKDSNTPVRNIWDTLDWANPAPQHLPLIQFQDVPTGDGNYEGDNIFATRFAIRIICWVASNQDKRAAERRARDLREQVILALHTLRPFSLAGAARQGLRVDREPDTYNQRFAVGLGVLYRGDLWLPATG